MDERYGWHADGDLCLGPECMNVDEATDSHGTDVHSDEWWDGYTEAATRLLVVPPMPVDAVARMAALGWPDYDWPDHP